MNSQTYVRIGRHHYTYVPGIKDLFVRIVYLVKGMKMGTVTINGIEYAGNNVSMVNGIVYIDGKAIDCGQGKINNKVELHIIGDVAIVKCDSNVTVNGNVEAGNNISCGNIIGNVNSGNNTTCGNVEGNVNSGNNVTCSKISGKIIAGGDVCSGRKY